MTDYYILDENGEPVPEPDVRKWGRWFETAHRQLAAWEIYKPGHNVIRVSTVFLGLDHSWEEGPPVLWETLVFGGPLDGEGERYYFRDEALAGHDRWVERVKKECP